MSDLELSEREAAIGATVAMQTIREEQRRNGEEGIDLPHSHTSTRATVFSILFVAVSSIGMLILMMVFDK